jgi:hypothetical protein
MRIKDEINFLHCKKQKLNSTIYHVHLNLAKSWASLWPHMQHTIEEKLQKECRAKYQTLDNKLKCLTLQKPKTPPQLVPKNVHLRVVNMTDISLLEPEMTLLQKGPKYNLHNKPKNWIQNLALEAETAISHLPASEREVYRKLRQSALLPYKRTTPSLTHNTHFEATTVRNIQAKLKDKGAMIKCADKGNSLVILPTTLYKSKVDEFIQANNFLASKTNPTKSFQCQIRKVINNSKLSYPQILNGNT